MISGTPLQNFAGEEFGNISLTEALTNSVNTVWAEVGEKLGRTTMAEYMKQFGFYEDPPMDYPDNQMLPSGEAGPAGRLLSPTSGRIDVGRMAIGQDKLLVTPLQMATVAQTIGNGGLRMQPRLVEKVLDPDGRTIDEPLPEEAERVMSQESADAVAGMMSNVVEQGTGTAARAGGRQRRRQDRHRRGRATGPTTCGSSASPTSTRCARCSSARRRDRWRHRRADRGRGAQGAG